MKVEDWERSVTSSGSNGKIKIEYQNEENRDDNFIECYDDQISENNFEEISNRSSHMNWTEDENKRLLNVVSNVGRNWVIIANDYKSHFKNRTAYALRKQYAKMKNKILLFQSLLEKSKNVKDVKILDKSYPSNRNPTEKWLEIELTCLVHCANKYKKKWIKVLKKSKNYFHHSRTHECLRQQYFRLTRDPKKLLNYNKRALF